MREAAFVQRNKAKWQRLEQVVTHQDRALKPDEVSALYIDLTDDLSYARTFYPGAQVTTYLNALAARLHQHIYKNRKTSSRRFLTFWSSELPLVMARTRKQFILSASVFLVAVIIGALSTQHDATFVRLIMGDAYVDMTLENIKQGTPMAVYGSSPMTSMFLGITFNNIMVAMYAFAAGLMLSAGTWVVLVRNGIMVGCFQYFMFQQGALRESVLSMWLHGTIEISSIVIAGAAGIVMGNGILFPGTYTRLASFRRSAKDGLKIVFGLVPCFIVAGFIESFLTRRSPDMPLWLSGGIIGASLLFIIGYFVIYPYHVERSHTLHPAPETA